MPQEIDRFVQLIRSVEALTTETKTLRAAIEQFTQGRPLRPYLSRYSLDSNAADPYAKTKTGEPPSAITSLLWDIRKGTSADLISSYLGAIARDLDGAFRDVRAVRADVEAIKDDSDLRAEFKGWKTRDT